jgi:hypothetical protein
MAMLAAARMFRSRRQPRQPRSMFLVCRDAHKSVFDGLRLCDSGAILLPYELDTDFQVSLGTPLQLFLDAIEQHYEEARVPTYAKYIYLHLLCCFVAMWCVVDKA